MAKELRGGYTTGACVAAGVKAAALFMQGSSADYVEINALDGTKLHIPVKAVEPVGDGIRVEIVKDSGDDPDITNGVSILTTLTMDKSHEGIELVAGEGVGTITKPGLAVPPGEPSINPGPRQLIRQSLQEVFGTIPGCQVRVDVPGGEELAKKTLNSVLGVVGGISIIGTTGVLRPMSEEAFKDSLVPQISVALAAGYKTQIFVPGKIGERIAGEWGLPVEAMAQTSNFIGHMLEKAADMGVERVLLFGHIGKLAKVAAGVFHTHNRMGDGRMETMAAYSAAAGMPPEGVQEILSAVTTEEALPVIERYKLEAVYDTIAARASLRAQRYVFEKMQVGTVMVTLKGKLLGMDDMAKKIGGDFGWNIR
ncbi:Cobalt-precorrin-6 synthase, anaerobic [Anaerovibrio sp. JC8]|uniref:cobalt-precorrin-5B (C(1))-methyltransferase CbiD n=1 Tax=Anaerovibrio sp. JC8 TaxID=1240085 RepID=UPI000A0CDDF3|nr:cobalt-precorrin-5B (C(1))-methyltransferase CbiD [Anaerovibrio sp. JC8]ORT99548.1 Cobalt-precorrin-6 synthase, anaerobic [Anaerovibrio sp. JC8]